MPTATYDVLATYTIPSATTSYTFTSIPQTYTDLELVWTAKGTGAGDYIKVRVGNGSVDTGANYSYVNLYASATTGNMGGGGELNKDFMYANGFGGMLNSANSTQANGKVYIFDYANTTTHKRTLVKDFGFRTGQADAAEMFAHSWRSTSAINTLQVFTSNYNIAAGSTFTLFGIKAGS